MFAIDCHDHVYNRRIAPKAVQSVGEFYSVIMNCSGTTDELLKIAESSQVKKFVINAVALSPKPVPKLNDFMAKEQSAHEEFTALGTLHPDMEGLDDEIERIIKCYRSGQKNIIVTGEFSSGKSSFINCLGTSSFRTANFCSMIVFDLF